MVRNILSAGTRVTCRYNRNTLVMTSSIQGYVRVLDKNPTPLGRVTDLGDYCHRIRTNVLRSTRTTILRICFGCKAHILGHGEVQYNDTYTMSELVE